jgi:hypothetical protein
LGEDGFPEPPRLVVVSSLGGDGGWFAEGWVTVSVLVHAAKPSGALQGQDSPPDRLGLTGLTGHVVESGLAEE